MRPGFVRWAPRGGAGLWPRVERAERAIPRVNVNREFPRTPAACGDSGDILYRRLRASRLPPAKVLHRSAVPTAKNLAALGFSPRLPTRVHSSTQVAAIIN